MTVIRRFLLLSLLLGSAVSSLAQEEVTGEQLQQQADQLEQGIVALQALERRIDGAPESDREALIYRRDDRSFRLLLELDHLVRSVAQLPGDDPARVDVEQRLQADLAGAGSGVLARIAELGLRIEELRQQASSLGGVELVTAEAYIQSLETQRFRYYDALVSVIEGRTALGMESEALTGSLLKQLYLHAESLVGRLEFTGNALSEVRERQQREPDNADVSATATEMSRRQGLNLGRLKLMVSLLDRLGEDTAQYQSVIVQQGEGISIAVLRSSVVLDLLRDGLNSLREFAMENGPDLLFKLIVFLLILLVFRSLSKFTRKAVKAACERPGVDMSTLLKDVLISVCGGTVTVIGLLIALSQIGISLGPMLAGLGVAGFVVGFALQDTLGNFAAGGMILIYRPYDVDDFVEVAGASGLVKKMSLVSTTITTFDNQTLVVPNSKIWGDVIKNVTAQKVRRVDLVFGIGYSDDIPKAERILEEILGAHDKVLGKPEPMVKLHELADSSVNFVVRPWVRTEDYWNVYWDITREVKMRFDADGVSIPFPQRDVHFYQENS